MMSGQAKASMASIKALREATDCPIMDCKKALTFVLNEDGGTALSNKDLLSGAEEWLRKQGKATATKKASRTAAEGLIGVYTAPAKNGALSQAIIEVNCETDFVSRNDKFQNLVSDITTQAVDSKDFSVLQSDTKEQVSTLVGALKENIMVRRGETLSVPVAQGVLGSYVHLNAKPEAPEEGVLLGKMGAAVALEWAAANNADAEVDVAGLQALANNLCMHVVAMRPRYLAAETVDAADLDKEREILAAQVKESGKPEHIVAKMVEGRMKKFYSTYCLLEQEYVVVGEGEQAQSVAKTLEAAAKAMNVTSLKIAQFERLACGEGVEIEEKKSLADEVASMV
jgi:elongation factor Ts